jgi:hypothetical protein
MTMTRRSTIGDNPLDSIGAPSPPAGRANQHPDKARKPDPGAKRPNRATTPAPDREALPPNTPRWLSSPFRRSWIRVVGGDVTPGVTRLSRVDEQLSFSLPSGEIIHPKRDVVRIEVQSEDTERRVDALLAWATAGAFLAGPLGALAGSLYGGRERRSTALNVHLHDDRSILMVTSPETAQEMQAELE